MNGKDAAAGFDCRLESKRPGASFSGALFISLLILLLVPHVLFVQTSASSLAAGLIFASLLIVAINFSLFLKFRVSPRVFITWVLIYGFILVGGLYRYTFSDFEKPFFTAAVIIIPLAACMLLSSRMLVLDYKAVENSFFAIFFVISIFGWVEILYGFRFLEYAFLKKPVFPFSEESHYALALGPLACAAVVNKSKVFKLLALVSALAQAFLFPNLTLLVFSVLMLFVFWGVRHIFFVAIGGGSVAIVLSALYAIYSDSPTIEYFSSRLVISAESTNLTTLVFLQGWDEAWNSLVNSYGLGLGFQMLGTNPPGVVADRILMLYGSEFNREDGGFLASKVISELGVLGVLVTLSFLVFIFKYMFFSKRSFMESKEVLFYSTLMFSYLVEFFLRGYGYFSPGLILVLACAMVLSHKKRRVLNG